MANDEKPTSIWKKEISFRRKPGEPGEGGAETAAAGGSIWKKELSLRKKEAEPVAEPVGPTAAADEPDPQLEAALASLSLPLEPVAAPEPEPAPAPPVEHDWLTQPLEIVSEPPAELPEPVALAFDTDDELEVGLDLPAELPAGVPTAVLPPLDLSADVPVELPEPPALPAAAAPEPAPTAALPEAKVPFYKKELSLKRGPKAEKAPKPEKAPKAAKEPKAAKAPKAEKALEGEKVPFYKRELSLKRGPKSTAAPTVTAPAAAAPAATASAAAAPAAMAPAAPKVKREKLSRPSLALPSFSLPLRGGGGGTNVKVIGLKIGGSQIAAARIVNGDQPELVQAVREPLEHGIVVGGELRDPEALAAALKDFFARHKLPKRGIRLGIANNRIGVRTFEVVGIEDPKQLGNAIRFRAQEVLPIPIEEAVLDYQVLSEGVTEDGQPLRRVLLVVAYRELVDRYVDACRRAGLQIVGIDLEAFALLRAIAAPQEHLAGSERGALVAVSVGHERSTFAVSDGRVCEFTRVLEWGGWALNVAIARALDMAPSEVEPLKRALSFAGPEALPPGFTQEQLDTARDAARKGLQSFARELVSSLQFYQNQPGSLGIGELAITGGTAHLPGLGAELERLVGVPVRIADPMSRLKVSKRVSEPEQVGSLAVAIGLGIED